MPTLTQEQIAQRKTNLNGLKTAVLAWAAQEEARISKESLFIHSVLRSRGADNAAALNLLTGSAALGDEIDRFLALGT